MKKSAGQHLLLVVSLVGVTLMTSSCLLEQSPVSVEMERIQGDRPTENGPADSTRFSSLTKTVSPLGMTPDQILPYLRWEMRYALSRRVDGTSGLTYQGKYMGDWNYVTGGTDNWAFDKKRAEYSGGTGTVGFGPYGRGGWCKFFVDLLLFRSSYGLGNGYHLYLPGGYTYATVNPRYAAPGWVLQSTMPHTALVDAPHYNSAGQHDGWWVIDANWVGGNGQFYISRHFFTFTDLDANSFKAWKPTLMKRY